jgi:cytoskeletal protein CcmA (bactofilin family)
MSAKPGLQKVGPLTVIGLGAELEGELRTTGCVQVEGSVLGTLSCGELVVSAQAGVLGEVHAQRVDVRGTIIGLVFAGETLHVGAAGRVQGHVRYEALRVERGGRVEGSTTCADCLPTVDDELS